MKKQFCILFFLVWFGFARGQVIPFSDKRWVVESQAHLIENYKGKNSLYLQNGLAHLSAEKLRKGIIEFDIHLFERVGFAGVVFRLADTENYEEIYFRPHQSTRPDAFQYTPVFNRNAAWQLYHDQYDANNDGFIHWKARTPGRGYNGVYTFPFDRWLHVRLVVRGTQAEFYLDHDPNPVAFISELLRGDRAGSVGVEANQGAVYFANFSVTHLDNPELKGGAGVPLETLPGTIIKWQISAPFKEDKIKTLNRLEPGFGDQLSWKMLPGEPGGLANISRLASLSDTTNTVWARITLISESDQLKKLEFGYSDRLRAYCNGQLLYSGNNGFRTRDYRYLGTIGYFDALYLPLKKGKNTLMFAVSESFGGWGIQAKLENMDGIKIE